MAALPPPIHTLAQAIYDLHERREADQPERQYLGASVLGEPCERRLWLALRWAARERISGRMARLFETGYREEARVLEELRAIGLTVWDRQADGSQWSVQAHGGHFRGHIDAVVQGMPEAPKTPHLVDVKTISSKRFRELQKHGLRKTYPKYQAQAQVYMGLGELERAAFIFVVKDDETIHVERIEFDADEFAGLMKRAGRIIFSPEPPDRICADPEGFECKFCPFHEHCHGTAAPAATCRSCAHSTPTPAGEWRCEMHDRLLDVDSQRAGCSEHRVIPILLARWAEVDAVEGDTVRYRNLLNGGTFANGEPPDGFTSAEIAACADKRALGEPGEMGRATRELREAFNARVTT